MTFISVTKAAKKEAAKSRNGVRPSLHGVALGVAIHKRANKKTYTHCLNFRFSDELLKKARLMKGDKLELLYDPTTNRGLIRLCDKGYTVIGHGRTSMNFSVPYVNGLTPYEKKCFPMTEAKELSVTSDGIIFVFPDVDYLND
jgi:hypothetical protein